jgi:hypothetical protein
MTAIQTCVNEKEKENYRSVMEKKRIQTKTVSVGNSVKCNLL